jgi:hypothetical protein
MNQSISTCTVTLLSLGYIEAGQWHPGISDPTPMGVIIFVCYFIGAAVCGVRAWRCLHTPALRKGHFRFWVFCGFALVLFGLNKQLDLHQLISQLGRDWARADGWYQDRREIQSLFMKCLAGAAAVTLLAILWALRGMTFRYYIALLGLMFLGFYVLIRTASFHNVDQFLGLGTEGFRLAWLVELGGIAITAVAAALPERAVTSDE